MKSAIGLMLLGAVVGVSAVGENLMLGGQSALLGGEYGSSTFFNPGQSALMMPATAAAVTTSYQQPLMNTWNVGALSNLNLGNLAYQQPIMASTTTYHAPVASYVQHAPLLSSATLLHQAPVLSGPITGAVAHPLPSYGFGAPMAQVNVAPLHPIGSAAVTAAAVTASPAKSAAVVSGPVIAPGQAPQANTGLQPTASAASAPVPAAQPSAFLQPATRVVPPVTPTGYVAIPLYSTGQPTEEDQRNQGNRDVNNRQQGTQSPAGATGGEEGGAAGGTEGAAGGAE